MNAVTLKGVFFILKDETGERKESVYKSLKVYLLS